MSDCRYPIDRVTLHLLLLTLKHDHISTKPSYFPRFADISTEF